MFNNFSFETHRVLVVRLVFAGLAFIFATLAFYGFARLSFVVSSFVALLSLTLLAVVAWTYRHRSELTDRKAAHHRRVAETKRAHYQALLGPVTPSNFTVEYGGFSEAELATLTYDRPMHWVVYIAMLINPFWLEDNRPHKTKARLPDRAVANTFRYGFYAVRIVYVLVFAVITLGSVGVFAAQSLVERWFDSSVASSPAFWIVLDVVHVIISVAWAIYIYSLWQRCRQVKTARTVGIIARQLPWTSYPGQLVPLDTYTSCQPDRPLAGKLTGYRHIALRTTEDPEPLPDLLYVSDGRRLEAQLQEQRKLNQERSVQPMRTTSGQRHGRVIPRTGPGR